ncbi:hypothetical protein SAMN05660461_0819 [Chitinophaga ginsengisegetis]|uniref:Uncharacterized protein n=1 Tax=Chitinophaga ginsengisegetis TaxID=393003 RepID=A0A1T5N957_9BACT|nr:hypothetical protein SAMN05660461_0819 [Chitinophaga ginsengisegetis]
MKKNTLTTGMFMLCGITLMQNKVQEKVPCKIIITIYHHPRSAPVNAHTGTTASSNCGETANSLTIYYLPANP